MRVIIIDDESLAREELKHMLSKIDDIDIVAEANNIDIAEQHILELKPDCIFLDINMPGGSGFILLERLIVVPHIIFTTAYTEYAPKAFEVGACDYLMKPIETERLVSALSRVKSFLSQLQKDTHTSPPTPDSYASTELNEHDKIFLKEGDACWLVNTCDIQLIESIGNYARLYFDNNAPLIKRSLSQLETRLPEHTFIRINRQYIANLNAIKSIDPIEGGSANIHIVLHAKTKQLEMSRRQFQRLKEKFVL